MNNDLISVIVPIYNVEKYLPECIESIINQTYKNIEIILVEDGCIDNCGQICDEYAKKDDRIKVVHKNYSGVSGARNAGLDHAKGKYISFVDSDDYINEQYLEKLYNAIIKNNTKIAQCNFIRVDDNKNEIYRRGYKGNLKIKTGYDMIKDIYIDKCWENIIIWNKLYYKDLFDEIRYPIGKIHEDDFVTPKILYSVDRVAIVEEYLYNYRKNQNSIMGKNFKVERLDKIEAYEERLKFFEENSEKELYELTMKTYLGEIRECYIKTRAYIENSKNVQKELVIKYKNNYKRALNCKYIDITSKFKMSIFYISPKLHYVIKQNVRVKRNYEEK